MSANHAANALRARTIELGVAANRVREATVDLVDTRALPLDAVNAFVELAQVVARLQQITRALAAEETP